MTKDEAIFLLEKIRERYKANGIPPSDVYVGGSQSILGIHESPSKLLAQSMEIDTIINDRRKEIPRGIMFSLGQGSPFAEDFSLEIDVVDFNTFSCSDKWIDRCKIEVLGEGTGYEMKVHFMDPHDLLFCKLIAGRDKDLAFVEEMFRCHLLSPIDILPALKDEDSEKQKPFGVPTLYR